jgi:hypothetical protein
MQSLPAHKYVQRVRRRPRSRVATERVPGALPGARAHRAHHTRPASTHGAGGTGGSRLRTHARILSRPFAPSTRPSRRRGTQQPGRGMSTRPKAPSAPIPIAPRNAAGRPGGSRSGAGAASASVPAAPLMGSLKTPGHLDSLIPDMALPAASPEPFSMVSRVRNAALHASRPPARRHGVGNASCATSIFTPAPNPPATRPPRQPPRRAHPLVVAGAGGDGEVARGATRPRDGRRLRPSHQLHGSRQAQRPEQVRRPASPRHHVRNRHNSPPPPLAPIATGVQQPAGAGHVAHGVVGAGHEGG